MIDPEKYYQHKEFPGIGFHQSQQHTGWLQENDDFPAAVKFGKGKKSRNLWLGAWLIEYQERKLAERAKREADLKARKAARETKKPRRSRALEMAA